MFDLSTEEGRRADRAARRDEISYFQDSRSIGACEAAWRLFGFDMAENSPAVKPLAVHLENGQRVYFTDTGEAVRAAEGGPPETTLTAWFRWNQAHGEEEHYPYYDMPWHCVWNNQRKMWTARRRQGTRSVGRVYSVSPKAGELFYLRLLLHHAEAAGAKSFADLKTVNGEEHETFRAACMEWGIIGDDSEWDAALREAAEVAMPRQIRELFVTLLTACSVVSPASLFDEFWQPMADDFKHRLQRQVGRA